MNVMFNGKELKINKDESLLILLNEFDMNTSYTAVAVNNQVIQKSFQAEHYLQENDVIEVLMPMQGG